MFSQWAWSRFSDGHLVDAGSDLLQRALHVGSTRSRSFRGARRSLLPLSIYGSLDPIRRHRFGQLGRSRLQRPDGGLSVFSAFGFLRFPFHPEGFVYGTGLGTLFWGSALVGWSVKTIVVRYGGPGTYQRVRPFFVGMIFGELGSRLVWGFLSLLGATGGDYDWW